MNCKYAKRTDQYYGYICSITEGACMYLVPDQDMCAEQYLPNSEQDGDFGKEENVTSGMPFKICDSCVGRMNKIIWDEFPYQDMSDEQG